MPADRSVFDANYLLYGLPQQVKDELFGMSKIETVNAHGTVISEDAKDVDLIVILKGNVAIYKGPEKLAETGPGAVLGEVALVDNLPRSARVAALSTVEVARIDGQALRKYMYQNRDAGFLMLANLSRVLSARLRSVSQQVEDLKGQARDPWGEHPL